MRMAFRHTRIMICVLLIISLPVLLFANTLPLIRISVENTASHVQTHSVRRFAERLSQELAGRYEVQFFPAASLYKDADVFRALTQGKLEVAVPGTWHFDRFVPEVALFLLPSLYGRDASVTYGLMESPVGERIISSIERNLDVKVLGRWIDLGHTHLFSTVASIKRPQDIVDKRVRVAGGRGNELRIAAMGGSPVAISWPELPAALQRGAVDAVLTSYETVASARLWEYGLRAVYEDRQYFAQYVPICSGLFWDSLPEDVRRIVLDAWDSIVDQARRDARVAQAVARSQMVSNGISVTMTGIQQIEQTRASLVAHEQSIVRTLGIADDLYRLFASYMRSLESATVAGPER